MRSLLSFLLLFSVSTLTTAQLDLSKDEALFVPWKPSEQQSYENKNTFAWKQGGGYFINDFVGLEGNVYKFKYYEKFRYNPTESSGFLKPEDYTLNVLGIGKIPVSKHFALFGKVGPSYYQNPFEDTETAGLSSLNTTAADALLGLTYSTGARVLFSPSLEFSLEYMSTQNDTQELEGTMAQMNWKF